MGAAKGKGPAPEWPSEGIDAVKVDELAELGSSTISEILDGLEREQAEQALTLWRGFGAFCDDTLGLDALKVLRVVLEPTGAARVDELESLAERPGLEPNAETVERMREGLTEAWCTVLRWGGG